LVLFSRNNCILHIQNIKFQAFDQEGLLTIPYLQSPW